MAVAKYSALALIAFLVSPIMVMVMANQSYEVDWSIGVDFTDFATQNTFFAGDVLNFHYDSASHNLLIATDSDAFDQCQMTPNLGFYKSGNEALTLVEPGNYYFMCEYNCKSDGMKMSVYVNNM
ncbi:putative cupredoxin [Rosa chinensis]|uniref:Putative cupredoxin n=1 Tax=Rosa chinensis TaxID=74649 RepID=A0A2P6SGG5_ROSCH|nr:uclacyanin-2 [Rosa chinensis]PRQ57785.1 putative cupredoxin [Rosa chinensis]